jgi:galactan 5-O-arabinofuranosyltransferase
VLRPGWALGIGVVAMLPFVEPVKPYPQITLVMLVPVLIAFYQRIRRAAELTRVRAVAIGALFGVGLGLLFLLYSGWFVWIAPSAVLVALLLTPWRTGLRPALLLVGTTTAVFIAISWVHLSGLFGGNGGVSDNYFYFDNDTEPTYFAMWRNDRPADVGSVWPPTGELGGVGLFTILLTVGLGVAIWFGWRRTAVIGLVSAAAGAWMIRMWLASEMYETQLVRLYPRTTMVILYCMLLLTGFGVMYAVEAARRWFAARSLAGPSVGAAVPAGLLLLPLVFFFASAGSATANRYLPNEDLEHSGFFSWYAHKPQLPDGTCSYYGQRHGICRPR